MPHWLADLVYADILIVSVVVMVLAVVASWVAYVDIVHWRNQ